MMKTRAAQTTNPPRKTRKTESSMFRVQIQLSRLELFTLQTVWKETISLNMMDTAKQRLMTATVTSVVDPHWFKSGSRSGSRKPNQCGSRIRIRVLIRLLNHNKLKVHIRNIFKAGKRSNNIFTKVQKLLWKVENQVYLQILTHFYLCFWTRIRNPNTDPDPRQRNECGSRWIRIHNTDSNEPCSLVEFIQLGTGTIPVPRSSYRRRRIVNSIPNPH